MKSMNKLNKYFELLIVLVVSVVKNANKTFSKMIKVLTME